MAILTTPPWNLPVIDVDVTRITVVANSNVSWSATRCLQYMALYGIPSGNLISLPFGTDHQYAPASTATFKSAVYDPLRVKLLALGGTLIVGAGVPCDYVTKILNTPGPPWTSGPATAAVSLWQLLAQAKLWTNITEVVAAAGGGLGGNDYDAYDLKNSTTVVALNPGTIDQFLGGSYTETFELQDGGPNYVVTVPDSSGLSAAVAPERLYVPYGKFGWGGWDVPITAPETDTTIGLLLNAITAALALPQQRAQTSPWLHSIAASGSSGIECDCAWVQQCKAWGMDVDYYFYGGGTPPPPFTSTVSLAGAVYPWATIQAGLSPAQQMKYVVQAGNTANGDVPNYPWLTNQAPLPGGVSLISGPSAGYQWNIWGVGGQYATGGVTDARHRNTIAIQEQPSTWYGLLRGLPLMLARHFQNFGSQGTTQAMGDPLWNPFREAPVPDQGQGYKRGYRWIA